jgi:uncharacterized protein
MPLTISQLYIYPIKSLGGIAVSQSNVTDRGLEFDRRWMLVDEENQFLTIREFPKMTRLHLELIEGGIKVNAVEQNSSISIQTNAHLEEIIEATIWNASVKSHPYPDEINQWFSEMLGGKCKLVYMPDESSRPVDTTSGYHPAGKFTSFADAYPFLLLSEESMNDLNTRFEEPLSILRFRPNIVFSGGKPYQEDEIEDFEINGVQFTGLENCARCGIPNVNPETGILEKDREPLKTLSKYRMNNKNIQFGRNTVHSNTGIIHVCDELKVVSRQ